MPHRNSSNPGPRYSRIIREFRTANFVVRVEAEPDYDIDFTHWDPGLAAEVQEKLERGSLELFGVKASASFRGHEIAVEYLGGCIYETPSAFMDHRGSSGSYGSYFADMVRTVCREARQELLSAQRIYIRNPKTTPE